MRAGGDNRRQLVDLGDRNECFDVMDEVRGRLRLDTICEAGLVVDEKNCSVVGGQTIICHDHYLSIAWKPPTPETSGAVGVLSGRGIKENVEGVDAAALKMRDIRARYSRGAVWRSGLPAQPSYTVMTDCGPDRRKGELWWQVR
jgi:hypothetical protein